MLARSLLSQKREEGCWGPTRRKNGLRHILPDRVTERTDGTSGSVDTATRAAIGPYRESGLMTDLMRHA
jgi:hypothetical protein